MRQLCAWVIVWLLGLVFLLAWTAPLAAQEAGEGLTTEEYQAELESWQKREADARTEIMRLEEEIAGLREEIAEVEERIEQVRDETFELLGVVKEEAEAFAKAVEEVKAKLAALEGLSAEELSTRQEEITDIDLQLEALRESEVALLEHNAALLAEAEEKLSEHVTRIPAPEPLAEEVPALPAVGPERAGRSDRYTVLRGDFLWRISGKDEIYGDPMQWVRIYTANRDQISAPDIIEVGQVFRIPREPAANEHWVMPGESLSRIAADPAVYGNPFEWTKLYEANRTVLTDPSRIYPHQILVIPRGSAGTSGEGAGPANF